MNLYLKEREFNLKKAYLTYLFALVLSWNKEKKDDQQFYTKLTLPSPIRSWNGQNCFRLSFSQKDLWCL